MNKRKWILLVVTVISVFVAVAQLLLMRDPASKGEMTWQDAIEYQRQGDDKDADKQAYRDAETAGDYMAEVRAKLDAMVDEGQLTEEEARAKMDALARDGAEKRATQ